MNAIAVMLWSDLRVSAPQQSNWTQTAEQRIAKQAVVDREVGRDRCPDNNTVTLRERGQVCNVSVRVTRNREYIVFQCAAHLTVNPGSTLDLAANRYSN